MSFFSKKQKESEREPEGRRSVRGQVYERPRVEYYSSYRRERSSAGLGSGRSNLSRQKNTKSEDNKAWIKYQSLKKFLKSRKLLWLIGAMLIAVLLLFVSSSSQIIVMDGSGNELKNAPIDHYQKTLQTELQSSLFNKTKLTVDSDGIAQRLKRSHPELVDVTITMPLLGWRPMVYVTQPKPVFELQQGVDGRYLLTGNGYIVGTVKGESKLPAVIDTASESIKVGEQLLPATYLELMVTAVDQLAAAGYSIDHLMLMSEKPYELDIYLKDYKYYIKFNFEEDALKQSGAAIATIKWLEDNPPKEYLDVRVPGRVYYK